MKVWKEATEIGMIHELPDDLKEFDREMRKKPNFDKFEKLNKNKKVRKKRKK